MTNKQLAAGPIGVFDSGLGGLTVLKALEKILPNESLIYFGDTAHLPYGSKSADTVITYSHNITEFLLEHKVKSVVIACNTASSLALEKMKETFDIPIFDVVSPSVEHSIKKTKSNKVGIIGTLATINSKAYENYFKAMDSSIQTTSISCPLFVPLIEEGWADTDVARGVAEIYLQDLIETDIDTLILGCTHYPIMENMIRSVLSSTIQLILSGDAVGRQIKQYLEKFKLTNPNGKSKEELFFVTDFPQKFDELGSRFLGRKLTGVKHISIL